MEDEGQTTRVVERGGRTVRVIRRCVVEVGGKRAAVEKAQFRVGSHESNDLVLDDPTVSKHHLELEVTAHGFRIADLASSNGTYLGGVRVGEITVTDPVELELGRARIRIVPESGEHELESSEREGFGTLKGRSPVMRELYAKLERVSRSDVTVLIEGETGVGKEKVAESLHLESARQAGPFVVVDCGAVAANVIESELFGHVRGAFSGADQERKGLFEMASGGTLFLDEVGELPLELQPKLLGAIAVERAVLALPETTAAEPAQAAPPPFFTLRALALEEFKRAYFLRLVEQPNMTLSQMARVCELDRRYLQRILESLGLAIRSRENES